MAVLISLGIDRGPIGLLVFLFVIVVLLEKLFPRHRQRVRRPKLGTGLAFALGFTNSEIAARLAMGEATAKTHVSHVLSKLGVRDRVQAVIVAYETGFATRAR